jgi:hypothetical protein
MARDKYHDQVRLALEKDGWTVTDDPYQLPMGNRRTYIDLGAERLLIGAIKDMEKIAVEIKTFIGGSDLQDFDQAIGQFLRYRSALQREEPDRKLYLAIPMVFYDRFFQDRFFVDLLEEADISVIVYDHINANINKWIQH